MQSVSQPARFIADTVTAMLLCAAMLLGGVLVSFQFRESRIYRQSQIIRQLYREGGDSDFSGWGGIAMDSKRRSAFFKFAGAVANAYVNFELIPVNEAETFTVVFESMGAELEIEEFVYQRRDLIITGISPGKGGYLEFLDKLREADYFAQVTGRYFITTGNYVKFEIECAAR